MAKYRKQCLTAPMLERLEVICRDLCAQWDITLDEFGGKAGHVHLALDMYPNIMPSKFINDLKTVSSRLIRKEFGEHLRQYYYKNPVCYGQELTA